MARRKNADPSVDWHLCIPQTLAAEVELLLIDPFLQRTQFGARSELIIMLLREWVNEKRQELTNLQTPHQQGDASEV